MKLFTSGDVTLTGMANTREFEWQLIAEVHDRRVAGVNTNMATADAVPATRFKIIKMKISRKWLPGGRDSGWSDWIVHKVNRSKIEAV